MLQSKLNLLKDLADKATGKEPILQEMRQQIYKFLQNPNDVEFPVWCVKNNSKKLLTILVEGGLDITKNFDGTARTSRTEGKFLALSDIAKQENNLSMQKFITSLTRKQMKLNMALYDSAKHGYLKTVTVRARSKTYAKYYQTEKIGVMECVKEGAVLDWKNKSGTTALMIAAEYGNLEVVKFLLKQGADVNARDCMGATPLMWASYSNSTQILNTLLDAGANVNAKDRENCSTPLIWWCTNSQDNVKAIKILLDHHANLYDKIDIERSAVKDDDRTAYDHALTKGNLEIARFIQMYRIGYFRGNGTKSQENLFNKIYLTKFFK